MADINNVVLVGRLARDAELKHTQGGMALGKFTLAINRRRKQGDQWIDEANFFNITVWGKTAEALHPYLIKGKQVGISGELRQNTWEQDGQKRSKIEIVANNVQLLGKPGENRGQSFNQEQNNQSGASSSFSQDGPIGNDFNDDEIPFI